MPLDGNGILRKLQRYYGTVASVGGTRKTKSPNGIPIMVAPRKTHREYVDDIQDGSISYAPEKSGISVASTSAAEPASKRA